MNERPQSIRSRVDAVTVFRLGAEVCRVAELDTPGALPAELLLSGLPLQLRDDTVRIEVEATAAGACPSAVGLRLALAPPPPDPALPPAPDEELRGAQAQLRAAQRQRERIVAQRDAIAQLESPPRPEPAEGAAPLPSPSGSRLALLSFRRRAWARLEEALASTSELVRQAQEALDVLEARRDAQHRRRQLRPHELRKEARIRLVLPGCEGPVAPRLRVVIRYLVPAARWAPAYSLALAPGASTAGLDMRALVCQRSGEDWGGASLTLSTADALGWSELPELKALRIGRAQPSPRRSGWRRAPEGSEALYADYEAAAGPPPQAAPAPVAEPSAPPPAPPPEPSAMFQAAEAQAFDLEERSAPPPRRAKRARSPRAAMACSASNSAVPHAPLPGTYGAGGSPIGQASPPSPPEPHADRDLLDYDGLRMAGPQEPGRGRLRPVSQHRRYLELLTAAQRAIIPHARELDGWVAEQVHRTELAPLPAGHQAPGRLDAFDHCWRCEARVDVPGDGRFHSVPVLRCRAESHIGYVSVPRETPEVFRSVALVNPLQAPLLAGPVDVTMAGDYLLSAALESVPAGGRTELGLGVEQALRVARNTRFSEHQRGVVSRQLELAHELDFELRNLLDHPVELELRERIPVSREGDEELAIETRSVEPPWEPWEQERAPLRGAYRWRVRIDPGQVRQVRASYTVTIAAKHELAGGNRRED